MTAPASQVTVAMVATATGLLMPGTMASILNIDATAATLYTSTAGTSTTGSNSVTSGSNGDLVFFVRADGIDGTGRYIIRVAGQADVTIQVPVSYPLVSPVLASAVNALAGFGVPTDGTTDATSALNLWAAALTNNVGVLPPLTYKITGPVSFPAGSTIFAYGAKLQAPSASAFNMVQFVGTSGAHKVGHAIYGLTVDMQATGLHAAASGFYAQYADNVRWVDCTALNVSFEGFLLESGGKDMWITRPRVVGGFGDGIHIGDVAGGQTISGVHIDHPMIRNEGDDGIGLTAGASNVFIVAPDIVSSGTGAGLDFSGCNNCQVIGGSVASTQTGIRVESFGGHDCYDNQFIGVRVPSVTTGQYGILVFNANASTTAHGNLFQGVTIEGGTETCAYVAGSSETVLDGCIFRTSGVGVHLDGTGPAPGILTRIRNNNFVGNSTAIAGLTNTNSGLVYTDGNMFDGVTAYADASSLPALWEEPRFREMAFFKAAGNTYQSNAAIAEVDPAARIDFVPAGTRVNLRVYIVDAGGANTPTVDLYDLTHSTVLQTGTFASGTTGWVYPAAASPVILSSSASLTVRFGRTGAGTAPGLTIKSAVLQVG